MRCAVIDIGSNSIRLCVYDCPEGENFTPIFQKRAMIGLAGYIQNQSLSDSGIAIGCETLREFCELARPFSPDHTGIFATASLRGLQNQEAVLSAMEAACGFRPEIISGEEEARLDFLGATHSCPLQQGLLADVGGGSTEIVWFHPDGPKKIISLSLGSLALSQKFVKGLIPTSSEIEEMRQEIREKLSEIHWPLQTQDCQMICGIGGTMRMMLRLSWELLHTDRSCFSFSPEQAQAIWNIASSKDPNISRTAYRVLPERMFSMVPGILIAMELHHFFGNETFYVSWSGAREGFLLERFLKNPSAGYSSIS